MKIYWLHSDVTKYPFFYALDDEASEKAKILLDNYPIEPIGSRWTPPTIAIDERDRDAWPTDFTMVNYNSTWPMFSSRAVEVLRDLLEPDGELLPVECEEGEFYIYRISHVLNAVDIKHSVCTYYDDGNMEDIKKPAIVESRVGNHHLFRLPRYIKGKPKTFWDEIYVTEHFVDRLKVSDLEGYKCELKWPWPKREVIVRAKHKPIVEKQSAKKMSQPPEPESAVEGEPLSRHAFLRLLWERAINPFMDQEWIKEMLPVSRQEEWPFQESSRALKRVLSLGASREDLSHIAREIAFSTVANVLYWVEEPGVVNNHYEGLNGELLGAGPRGEDGISGTWPPVTGKAPTPGSSVQKRTVKKKNASRRKKGTIKKRERK